MVEIDPQSPIHGAVLSTENISEAPGNSNPKNHNLKILLLNARSVVNKLPELEAFVALHNPDILCVTETWLHSEILSSEVEFLDYGVVREDRPMGKGGGCVVLHKKHLPIKKMEIKSPALNPEVQALWCKVGISDGAFALGVVYKSPTASEAQIESLAENISLGCKLAKDVIVCGDFNMPKANWQTLTVDSKHEKFLQATMDNFLVQHVNEPTRGCNVLDLVFTSEGFDLRSIEVLPPLKNSDHCSLKFSVPMKTNYGAWKRKYRDYRGGQYKQFRGFLRTIKWTEIFANINVHEMWSILKQNLNTGIEKFIPQRLRKLRPKPMWWTNKIVQVTNEKLRRWKRYRKSRSEADYANYIDSQRYCSKIIRKQKRSLEKKISANIKRDPKAFFKYVRSKMRSGRDIPQEMLSGSQKANTDKEISELFGEYFGSVFQEDTGHDFPIMNNIVGGDSGWESLIEPRAVEQVLRTVNPEKSMGADEIHPAILHHLAAELCIPLSMIFQRSLQDTEIPVDWKLANVTPIHKKGNTGVVENYRPVSLTSQTCRVFERILQMEVIAQISNSLHPNQHGFLKRKSCLTNLLTFTEKVTAMVDAGSPVDVVYLDYAKAFDKVPHRGLILKMRAIGISENIVNWVEEWLRNRKQRVVIRGQCSPWAEVTSGVPQGSVLGPVLFLVYVDDLQEGLSSHMLKFADDTKIFRDVKSPQARNALQQDLNLIGQWSEAWRMSFNVHKCSVMHFGHNNEHHKYQLEGGDLSVSRSEKDLGVHIQDDLQVDQQVGAAVRRANRMLGLIFRTYTCKSRENMIPLYKSLVRPHLEYAVQAWRPYKQKDIDLIERVQRRATKMIHGLENLDYPVRLQKAGLISLEMRRHRADLLETFKIFKGLEGLDKECFFPQPISRTRRSNHLQIRKQRSRLNSRMFVFSQRVVNEWNRLPSDIVDVDSVNAFKNKIAPLFNNLRSNTKSQRWLPAPISMIGNRNLDRHI